MWMHPGRTRRCSLVDNKIYQMLSKKFQKTMTGQVSMDMFICGQEGHFKMECPWWKPSPGPCPTCQGNHWKAHSSRFQRQWRPEPPTQLQVLGPPIRFLWPPWNQRSPRWYYWKAQGQLPYWYWSQHFIYFFLSWSSKKISVQDISGQSLEHYFTQPLAWSWGDFHFCYSFLIVPETSTPLLKIRPSI
jgi:hypothetical protein